MTAPSENGDGPSRCMLSALKDAGLNVDQVEYLNAHGTVHAAGRPGRTMAMKRALGDHAYKMIGQLDQVDDRHLLGAAGGVGRSSAMALHRHHPADHQPDHPGEGCDLDYVPQRRAREEVDVAMSNGSASAAPTARWCSADLTFRAVKARAGGKPGLGCPERPASMRKGRGRSWIGLRLAMEPRWSNASMDLLPSFRPAPVTCH